MNSFHVAWYPVVRPPKCGPNHCWQSLSEKFFYDILENGPKEPINPILHGLFKIPYYMGGSNRSPPTKLTENAKNGLGFMFYTSNVC